MEEKIPSVTVSTDLYLKKYCPVSGKRLFLQPNLMNRSTFTLKKNDNRKSDIVIPTSYTDIDTIHYHLPESIYPEAVPEPTQLKTVFGEYESSFILEQGKLTYIRRLRINKGTYSREHYSELMEFYRNINKADHAKVVFMSKT